MDTHYLVVDPAGSPVLKGADMLEAGGFYRAHILPGHGLMTEAEFREWASGLCRTPGGRPDIDRSTIPDEDAPMEALVEHCNRVGWRVLALLGENVYLKADAAAIKAAADFYSRR